MENIQALIHGDTKYDIIGQNLLQITLTPGEKIITDNQYIQYHSVNISSNVQRGSLFTPRSQTTTITNNSKQIAYIAVSHKSRVMVMDAALFNNYHVREQNILAYNEIVELIESHPLQGRFKKMTLNSKQIHRFQVVFLCSDGLIVDKDLGSQEQMIVKENQIIACSDQLKWKYHSFKTDCRMILIQGPGRIFLDLDQKSVSTRITQLQQISMISTTFFAIAFFLILSTVVDMQFD